MRGLRSALPKGSILKDLPDDVKWAVDMDKFSNEAVAQQNKKKETLQTNRGEADCLLNIADVFEL